MVTRAVLLMAEYSVDDSPLWWRVSSPDIGHVCAERLGLSVELRADLQAWNDWFDRNANADEDDEVYMPDSWDVDAFELAARVQQELGDDTHVWCGAGGPADRVPDARVPHPVLVVCADDPGTTVELRTARGTDKPTVAVAGGSSDTARAIIGWRRLTERIGRPFGNAETRTAGLRAAAALQHDIGRSAQVVFLGGARSKADYEETRRTA